MMATRQPRNSSYINGRVDLALQAFGNNQFKPLQAAARSFDVPITTLRRRAGGVPQRSNSRALNCKLSVTEEESLQQWILSVDQRGMPPRIASVREMADLLLSKRSDTTTPPTVGQNWVRNFVNRSPELRSKYNRKYDYQREKCEDPIPPAYHF